MKESNRIVLSSVFISLITLANITIAKADTDVKGCMAKELQIKQEIEYAINHDNHHRVSGLEKALSELKQNCTDEKLLNERKNKILEKERKVSKRKVELEEAKETGNTNKINKKEKKLIEAQAELDEAKLELTK